MRDRRDHPVHEFGRRGDGSPEGLSDRLVSETHTERRHPQPRGDAHGIDRRSSIGRCTWARREHHRVVRRHQLLESGGIRRIRFDHVGVCAELLQVSDQGVHEAVVVVDHEHSRHSTSTSPGAMIGLTQGNTYQNSP